MIGETRPDRRAVEGAILGSAVADAFGVPGEFMSRQQLKKKPITDMIGGGAHGQLPGTWSDDTSMVLCTVDSLIERGIDFEDQMARFADWLGNASNTARDAVFDVGNATRQAIFRFTSGTPAVQCGGTSDNACGNGSLMRIIPTALYLAGRCGCADLDDRIAGIIHDTSRCTHGHPRCQMACGIFCAVVFRLCRGGSMTRAVSDGIASALSYYEKQPAFSRVYPDFADLGSVADWDEARVSSSGYVLHTLQAALWCLLTTEDYGACVRKAVNLGDDTDTTAAVAGALAGLHYGAAHIPADWAEKTAKYGDIQRRAKDFWLACRMRDGL